MTNPAELCFDDERFNTRYFTSLQHFCIVYLILPCDPSYVMQTTHVELIKTAYMTSIVDPRLAAVQQGRDDYSFIDCNFVLRPTPRSFQQRVSSLPNAALGAPMRRVMSSLISTFCDRTLPR